MSIPSGAAGNGGGAGWLSGLGAQDVADAKPPSPWTTSEPREGLRDDGQGRIVCLSPSVNLTPSGGGMVPVPYMVHDLCDHMNNYSTKTFYTSQRVLRLCSNTTHVHGDEAGTGGGVISGTHGGICEPIDNARRVRVEGSEVVRHLDRFWMNNRNTVGEAVFVRDMATYPAPIDDDPLPGSARMTRVSSPGAVMSDALPDASLFRPGAQLAFSGTGLLEPPVVEPPIVKPVAPPSTVTWGDAGKIVGGEEAAGGGPEDPAADVVALATLLYLAVRISQEKDRKQRCLVDKYEVMKGICAAKGMQAHHIVPDYTLRYGNRGEAEANNNRILADSTNLSSPRNFPTFDNGMSICLGGNAKLPKGSELAPDDPEREHSAAHAGDVAVAARGSMGTPKGTSPIRAIAAISVGSVIKVKPECAPEITAAIAGQYRGVNPEQLGRTTQALPTGEALNALRAGHVQGYAPGH